MASPIVLITGGSRGLGAAAARLAASRGFDVAANYKSNRAAADAVVADVKKHGRRAIAVQGDMAIPTDVERVFAEVDTGLGRLTHLVYSSGIVGPPSRVEAISDEALQDVMGINVLGAFYCARAAIKRISTKHGGQGGAIVLVSSVAAQIGGAGEFVCYAASKGAIDTMTKGLAQELAKEGVRVNAVSPGVIDTDIQPPGRVDRLGPLVPMGRAGTADEVAEAIVFLLDDRAGSYITAANLGITGGR
ncbi:glucose 1-dehydrogenase 1 [Variibacter gotjawalensis]|uniref:Glucose 1-dehydrogenase 1 n=1 Tax=Variibacter gotjawalensis TaxID=1333996 RepID=A0A0S3PXN0_9BRAD|nr:SDR family oxidoreductase [Variibacter gotjawalensis]NIK46460.1 NAD(P)-dependent dehydrogenase (short-subunit alcohol dehydrogenase family) [Variibacter gotjawalensis]RZS48370.1 NAD(P)-dependent dehydrogenase (short-subunit alcohol dehydrogenase family) [Variibacter gotjawalensis]BAT60628.1 glucose 1-dehydrogenase 1 [Variibacter gotjawalensis]